MSKRLVEFTETTRLGSTTYESGDRKGLEPALAQHCIDAGWAKDAETGEQGERKPGASGVVIPDNVVQESA